MAASPRRTVSTPLGWLHCVVGRRHLRSAALASPPSPARWPDAKSAVAISVPESPAVVVSPLRGPPCSVPIGAAFKALAIPKDVRSGWEILDSTNQFVAVPLIQSSSLKVVGEVDGL